jgi:hypothetical protein
MEHRQRLLVEHGVCSSANLLQQPTASAVDTGITGTSCEVHAHSHTRRTELQQQQQQKQKQEQEQEQEQEKSGRNKSMNSQDCEKLQLQHL